MVPIASLWLPIILATVFVWIASAIAWTASPHHKSDFRPLDGEDGFLNTLRSLSPSRGEYWFPFASTGSEMRSPEMLEKMKTGPVGILRIWRTGPPNMPKAMFLSVLYYLVITVCVAYLTGRTVEAGTEYLHVFRVSSTIATLAYSAGIIPEIIWFGMPAGRGWKSVADGVVYGLLTGGTFGWLWPV